MKYRPNYKSVATAVCPSFVTIIKYPIPYSWLFELMLEIRNGEIQKVNSKYFCRCRGIRSNETPRAPAIWASQGAYRDFSQ